MFVTVTSTYNTERGVCPEEFLISSHDLLTSCDSLPQTLKVLGFAGNWGTLFPHAFTQFTLSRVNRSEDTELHTTTKKKAKEVAFRYSVRKAFYRWLCLIDTVVKCKIEDYNSA